MNITHVIIIYESIKKFKEQINVTTEYLPFGWNLIQVVDIRLGKTALQTVLTKTNLIRIKVLHFRLSTTYFFSLVIFITSLNIAFLCKFKRRCKMTKIFLSVLEYWLFLLHKRDTSVGASGLTVMSWEIFYLVMKKIKGRELIKR